MAVSVRPRTVEQGEWVAHQGNARFIDVASVFNYLPRVVEHYHLLWNFVRVVRDKEADGESICNPASCPKMSAGRLVSARLRCFRHDADGYSSVLYTWINVDQEPVELPAHECMKLLQQWISAKIEDGAIFPTDPSGVSSAYNSQHSANSRPARTCSDEDWLGICSGFPEIRSHSQGDLSSDVPSLCSSLLVPFYQSVLPS